MKTILYQPLFINPQAYFVFPQLYHIEKGDSYIEPANITGQLIINDLTQSLTSTPTLNIVFERFKPDGVMAVQSFGAWNDVVSTTDSCISYLTKNKYNGIDIRSGIGADDDMLSIGGALNKGNIELTSVCCHGDILVFNRSLTEYEISWVKNNMMCSKQQEPDIDL